MAICYDDWKTTEPNQENENTVDGMDLQDAIGMAEHYRDEIEWMLEDGRDEEAADIQKHLDELTEDALEIFGEEI